MVKRPPRSAASSATESDAPTAPTPGRDASFVAAQVLAMKAARLEQDLGRLGESADRATALEALATRLTELQAAHAKLQPATDTAKAKAAAAKATLDAVAKRLATSRAGGETPRKSGEDF